MAGRCKHSSNPSAPPRSHASRGRKLLQHKMLWCCMGAKRRHEVIDGFGECLQWREVRSWGANWTKSGGIRGGARAEMGREMGVFLGLGGGSWERRIEVRRVIGLSASRRQESLYIVGDLCYDQRCAVGVGCPVRAGA